jgi:hypothetical protein
VKKLICAVYLCALAASFLWDPAEAAHNSIPMSRLVAENQALEKPQIAIDLEGLDPREGGISKGLRGTFMVKHYRSGPWAGGTAVIELASDLSYAEIRIFDKDGNLQRIYSVQPKNQNTRINAANMNNPLKMVEEVNAANAANTAEARSSGMNVTRSPQREAAVQQQTAEAIQAERQERESEGDVAMARPGKVSNRAGDIREGSTLEAIEASEREASQPRKRTMRVRRKRAVKRRSSSGLDTPLSGSAAPKEEYYYEEVVVVDKPESEAAAEEIAKRSAKKNRGAAESANEEAGTVQTSGTGDGGGDVVSGDSTGAPSRGSVESALDAATREARRPEPRRAETRNEEAGSTESQPAESAPPAAEKRPLASDQWKPAKTQAAPVPVEEEQAPPPPVKRRSAAVPEENLADAQKAARKLDSDGWVPKPVAAAPSDAELGLNANAGSGTSTARRKTRSGRQTQDMVPLSDQARRGAVNAGSEDWSPNAQSPKLDSKDEAQLAMTNGLKKPQDAPVVNVNRDVHNPDEAVLPYYSLEKFSGAQYGRHREFERRVVYKQNKKSSFKGYDFYIDEVDRKQEKHYLYYYRMDPATKKAKLLATEKHEQVTFLSNYDIGSEDKGKIDKE